MHGRNEAPEKTLDDPELLRLMLRDLEGAPEVYKATNYWANYARRFVPELFAQGLAAFRRRRGSVLSSFGATDFAPTFGRVELARSRLFWNRLLKHIPGWKHLLAQASAKLNQPGLSPVVSDVYGYTVNDLQESAFLLAANVGEKAGAKGLAELEASLIGDPEDVFVVGGRPYTMRTLYYYLRYAYCHRFVDFDGLGVIVELGPGAGRQVEVIRKLHPDITFVLFDIPPQLYVCEQYLKAVFGDAVISYRETRKWQALSIQQAGAVVMLGSWQFPLLAGRDIDLFWNAVSFQEMEPEVVENYLRYVNGSAAAVYLQEKMEGKEVAERAGEAGVLRRTTLVDYEKGLSDFELVDVSPCWQPLGELRGHSDSFWKRRAEERKGGMAVGG